MGYLNKNMLLPDDEIIEEEVKEENKDIFPITEDTIFEDAKYDSKHRYPIFILLMHSGTPLANAIKVVTRAQYSHACISFNAGLDPIYSFGGKTKAGEKGFGFVVRILETNSIKSIKPIMDYT